MNKRKLHKKIIMFCFNLFFITILFVTGAHMNHGLNNSHSVGLDNVKSAMPEARIVDEHGELCRADDGFMCLIVRDGYERVVYNISNPRGITGFTDYKLANFEQRVIAVYDTSIDVEVISHLEVDTRSGFPVNQDDLPLDIKNQFLKPESSIQSDAPEIIAKANELVQEAKLQAEAVENILTWVRAHITYDSNAPGNDALSVFINRRAVCAGFSRLSVALLRAAGIPSRYARGCATPLGYVTGEGGGWHAWIEVYYPDVGWIPMEPQVSANFIYPRVIMHGFDQCGKSGTIINDIDYEDNTFTLYNMNTPYGNSVSFSMWSASIPAWERHPLSINPKEVVVMLPISDPIKDIKLSVEHQGCFYYTYWQTMITAEWLSPSEIYGDGNKTVTLTVDASNMSLGSYETEILIYDSWQSSDSEALQVIPVKLLLVETVHNVYAPLIFR